MPVLYDNAGNPYLEPPYTPEELAIIERVAYATPRLIASTGRRGDCRAPQPSLKLQAQPEEEGPPPVESHGEPTQP